MWVKSYHKDAIPDHSYSETTHTSSSAIVVESLESLAPGRFKMTYDKNMPLSKADLAEQCELLELDRRWNKSFLWKHLNKIKIDGL